jgi:multidrug efflux pump
VVWLALGAVLYQGIEQELVPGADRNVVLVWTQAPEGSTIDYTDRYQREAEVLAHEIPETQRVLSIIALGLGTPGLVNEGLLIDTLVPQEERDRTQEEVVHDLDRRLAAVPGIRAFAASPSPLRGFGSAPVSMVIQGSEVQGLAQASDEVMDAMGAAGGFKNIRSDLFLNKPQLEVLIDRDRASDLGVSVRDIATTLQILLGGMDLTTFKLEGETYNVMAQLRRKARSNPRDLLGLYVHGNSGVIPLASVVTARESVAPRALPHFDRLRSTTITAYLDDISQGEALTRAKTIAEEVLPRDYRIAFTGDSERFFESGNALLFAYGLALLIVYLVLAAQFESFVHPFVILTAVALSFTGALVTLKGVGWMNERGWTIVPGTLNLFSKIGLVMLVGLVTKNSILIVEFANQLRDRGVGLVEATAEASRTRFRPILMTALATMVGILPIAIGRGAGGESRAPLGVAVVGGMFFSTVLTFFVVPATYVVIEGFRERVGRRGRTVRAPAAATDGA